MPLIETPQDQSQETVRISAYLWDRIADQHTRWQTQFWFGARRNMPRTLVISQLPDGAREALQQRGALRGNRAARRAAIRAPRVVTQITPAGDDRNFGVELEFGGISWYTARRAMEAAGMTNWNVTTDGSIMNGGEAISPILSGEAGREELRRACRVLREAGATVTRSCGTHVHHDIRDLTGPQIVGLFKVWNANQHIIESFVSPSRRNGRWCQRISIYDVQRIERVADRIVPGMARTQRAGLQLQVGTRYKALNIGPYTRQGTVENRMHQGTLDPEKIIAWIDFMQATITACCRSFGDEVPQATDVDGLLSLLKQHGRLADTTAEFMQRRARQLVARPRRRPQPTTYRYAA